MKRNVAFVLGLVVGLAFLRFLRRQAATPSLTSHEPAGDPRAAELRRKLVASRAGEEGEREGGPGGHAADPVESELDRARAAVHREAHATLDEMRRAGL